MTTPRTKTRISVTAQTLGLLRIVGLPPTRDKNRPPSEDQLLEEDPLLGEGLVTAGAVALPVGEEEEALHTTIEAEDRHTEEVVVDLLILTATTEEATQEAIQEATAHQTLREVTLMVHQLRMECFPQTSKLS